MHRSCYIETQGGRFPAFWGQSGEVVSRKGASAEVSNTLTADSGSVLLISEERQGNVLGARFDVMIKNEKSEDVNIISS